MTTADDADADVGDPDAGCCAAPPRPAPPALTMSRRRVRSALASSADVSAVTSTRPPVKSIWRRTPRFRAAAASARAAASASACAFSSGESHAVLPATRPVVLLASNHSASSSRTVVRAVEFRS
jgi:hypothetical protein